MRRMLALLAVLALARSLAAEEPILWTLENGIFRARPGAEPGPLAMGSLLKPFVAKAWAHTHPGVQPPVEGCGAASRCWRAAGHGTVGLRQALAVSCNTYFNKMAAETPAAALESVFRAEGFSVPSPLTPEAAIGLVSEEGAVAARPEALLRAYARLVAAPWPEGEDVRRAVLAGLRDGAERGTARGLGRRGLWAKTGTVPALDGRPLATSGWAVAVDDSGWAVLALLRSGTGREAAAALAGPLARLRPGSASDVARSEGAASAPLTVAPSDPAPPRVRIGLLDALAPRVITARNLATAPAGSSRGFVGPQASLRLRPGDRMEESRWELALPFHHLVRRIVGTLAAEAGPADTLRLRAELRPEEYVAGVLAAELPEGDRERRVALGAAVLRFLADGPRHGTYDVCDQTHCAWFVGRGPRVLWPGPRTPVLLARGPGGESEDLALDGATWASIRAEERKDGPRLFTAHCGGEPLSAHFVWGNGDRRVFRCDRHGPADAKPWSRLLSDPDIARAFGAPVERLELTTLDGIWTLRVSTSRGDRDLLYDEAHRRLAGILGWDALPSPATRIYRTAGGFRAEGVGRGHRVGLCLGE